MPRRGHFINSVISVDIMWLVLVGWQSTQRSTLSKGLYCFLLNVSMHMATWLKKLLSPLVASVKKIHQLVSFFNRPFPSCLLTLCQNKFFLRNHSYENVFCIQVYFHANQTHFHMKGISRLDLKQRRKITREWPVDSTACLGILFTGVFRALLKAFVSQLHRRFAVC